MRKGLKVLACIIDVALMPVRALLELEVLVNTAIVSDVSVKDALLIWVETLRAYPSVLKEATKIIFTEES